MALFGIAQNLLVASDQREVVFARGGDQDTVGWIAMNIAGKPGGFDEDARGEFLQDKAVVGCGFQDKIVDGTVERILPERNQACNLQDRDRGDAELPKALAFFKLRQKIRSE